MSEKMWAGRFSAQEDKRVNDFNSSIRFDCRMYKQDIKGSIEPGKLADVIVLDRDILDMDTMDLNKVEVDMTVIDGVIEYTR